jgi:hypothetical protein
VKPPKPRKADDAGADGRSPPDSGRAGLPISIMMGGKPEFRDARYTTAAEN